MMKVGISSRSSAESEASEDQIPGGRCSACHVWILGCIYRTGTPEDYAAVHAPQDSRGVRGPARRREAPARAHERQHRRQLHRRALQGGSIPLASSTTTGRPPTVAPLAGSMPTTLSEARRVLTDGAI